MQSGSLFRLLMIGCVGEVARGASGTAESSQLLSASLRRMTRESPARVRPRNKHRRAPVRCGRALQNRRAVLRRTTARVLDQWKKRLNQARFYTA
jgi:hypothetical protein